MTNRLTAPQILDKKRRGERIAMLTAYDYSLARLVDQAGIDIILVGDSLANVVLGLESTRDVGMDEMLHHAKAVNRAVEKALLVGDMPYGSYQKNVSDAVVNARRFVEEAGCNAVKLEWFDGCLPAAKAIVSAGIPVMGHVGLTPQTADSLGGFKVQGKDAESAQAIVRNALDLEKQGCFSIVLECIPAALAELITQKLSIPTIGIGAGVGCDGQVLVTHDVLGLFDRFQPKFAKQFINLGPEIVSALKKYREEVASGRFPSEEHSFKMSAEEIEKLKKGMAS